VKVRTARDYKEFLRSGRWFASLPEELQDALVDAGRLRTLGADEHLFARGEPPTGLFALLDGAIRVSGTSESGREALLALLEPPAWFGEISVFDGQPRTHDAISDGESRVVQVPQAPLLQLLDGNPRWWRDLGLLAAGKLRLAFIAMEDMVLLPIAQRLARRLSLMAEGYGERSGRRTVEVSQDQLAMMVSTSRQTANQVLKEMEHKGLIRVSYGSIEILDLDGLRRLIQ
jgi:CRP/FNR family cyclic AMP-dependent transcriptional regulator